MTPKTNIDKWDYMKLKNICASQDTIGRKNNQWNEIKYLRTIYLRGTKYPEYVRTTTQEKKIVLNMVEVSAQTFLQR